MREYTEKVKPPRTVFLNWPLGHPVGRPFQTLQQRAVLVRAFQALYRIRTPGEIKNIPFRWERDDYEDYNVRNINLEPLYKS